MSSQTPEGRVKKAVKAWLVERNAYFYMPMSNGMGRVGAPDFIVCLAGGRFCAIETKAKGKRHNTTPNQDREIRAINTAGGFAIVVDDVSQLAVLDKLYEVNNADKKRTQEDSPAT